MHAGVLGVRRVYCWQPRNSRHNFRVLSIGIDGPSAVLAAAAEVNNVLRDARSRVDLDKADFVLIPATCADKSDSGKYF